MLFCVFYFSGMSILQEIQVSGTRRNPFADVALQNLLNSNLSAKYSLTGHLSKLIPQFIRIFMVKFVKVCATSYFLQIVLKHIIIVQQFI